MDSNDLAFRLAANGAVRSAIVKAGAVILEPVMSVEVSAPEEYQVHFPYSGSACVTLEGVAC